MEADDGRRVRVSPLDDVQLHAATILPSVRIEVVDGDIASLDVDAVANAANDRLWMGAGVAGALKRAGGEEIEREAMATGPDPRRHRRGDVRGRGFRRASSSTAR